MPRLSSGAVDSAGRPPSVDPAEATGPGQPESTWVLQQIEAMARSRAQGVPMTAEDLLARHPGIVAEAAIRLIYEEVCLRRESGEEVATSEVVGRFPQWKDELEILLDCDRLLRPLARVAALPEIGEDLGPFRLLAELGRGASGRTYLAAEPSLADRLVVLKVFSDEQDEHLSLARLQHTHIIPLFSEHTFPDRGLRAMCMPYLGGTSLARLLEALAGIPPAQRRGRHMLEVLDQVPTDRPTPFKIDGPYRHYLEQASYVQSVCWIVACLAEGLQCAHAHGLVHMDVKPSNVLIAADGLPMLLDFHLARRPIAAGEQIPDRIGGTPDWMAPEHRAALEAVSLGKPVPQAVDHRADLYSLGLLLREALGGPAGGGPHRGDGPTRPANPLVSPGLTDLVARCLSERPADRYPSAAALAEDLRRHLNDLPLRGVPNRSLRERWRKWRRRRPEDLVRRAAWSTALVSVAAVLGLVAALVFQRVQEIQTTLQDARDFDLRGRFPEAIHTLSHGLELAAPLPFAEHWTLTRDLRAQLDRARWGRQADALHDLADHVRFRYGIEPPTAGEAKALLAKIRVIWDARDRLLAPKTGQLDSHRQQQIRTDLLELVTVWADLRTRLAAPAEAQAARDEAWQVLEEASDRCGPSLTIARLRRAGKEVRHRDGSAIRPALDPVPLSAADHYDLGRSLLREEKFPAAAEEFRRTLEDRPLDFWPNFYQGLCAYKLGKFQDAYSAFGICAALAPGSAECFFNRARAAEAMGRVDQALRDYHWALDRDPNLTSALLNRGILASRAGRHAEAVADFQRALETSSDPRTLGRIHYNLALTRLAQGEPAAALAHAEQALAQGYDAARGLRERLRPESQSHQDVRPLDQGPPREAGRTPRQGRIQAGA